MITKIQNVTGLLKKDYDRIIKEGAAAILRDDLVAFPTETVYGLGANGLSAYGIEKIYLAKGRPSDNPLILHIDGKEKLSSLAEKISPQAEKLIDLFWPGPLTLIFKKKEIVPLSATGGLDTVALRMPANQIALDLIKAAGLPIAAPSANLSGRPSPTKAAHVYEDLNGRVGLILDGGSTKLGLESTIVDVSADKPCLLRPGAITVEMIAKAIGPIDYFNAADDFKGGPKAPGMKYTHYAPKANVIVIRGEPLKAAEKIKELTMNGRKDKIGIMASDQTMAYYESYKNVFSLGDRLDLETISARLFDTLRKFDYLNVETVYAESYPEEGLGAAVMNRLLKAAGHEVIGV